MSYRALVYFNGPMTKWSKKVDESEVIASFDCPWLWMARLLARSCHKRLDGSRCGYAITSADDVVEQVDPI